MDDSYIPESRIATFRNVDDPCVPESRILHIPEYKPELGEAGYLGVTGHVQAHVDDSYIPESRITTFRNVDDSYVPESRILYIPEYKVHRQSVKVLRRFT